MNRYDFTQSGGFPFDQGVMAFIQECIKTSAQAASLGGPLAILSGCTVNGNSVSNGIVVINGETLPFIGGSVDTKVVIVQDATTVIFQNGEPKVVKYERSATFGDDGVSNYQWSKFKRNTTEGVLARLERLEWLAAPDLVAGGGMRLWRRPFNEIPAGWREVVEWRGRLPMGYDPNNAMFDQVGEIGGAAEVSILKANLPNIRLNSGLYNNSNDYVDGNAAPNNVGPNANGNPILTAPLGDSVPLSVLDPYRVVIFIEPIPNYLA